jgi:hypothetical protein
MTSPFLLIRYISLFLLSITPILLSVGENTKLTGPPISEESKSLVNISELLWSKSAKTPLSRNIYSPNPSPSMSENSKEWLPENVFKLIFFTLPLK